MVSSRYGCGGDEEAAALMPMELAMQRELECRRRRQTEASSVESLPHFLLPQHPISDSDAASVLKERDLLRRQLREASRKMGVERDCLKDLMPMDLAMQREIAFQKKRRGGETPAHPSSSFKQETEAEHAKFSGMNQQQMQNFWIANNINAQGTQPGANSGHMWNQSAVPPQKEVPNQSAHTAGYQRTPGNSSSMHSQGVRMAESFSKMDNSANCGLRSQSKAAGNGVVPETKAKAVSEKLAGAYKRPQNQKRGWKTVIEESSERCDTDKTDEDEVAVEDDLTGQNAETTGSRRYPQRLTRQNQHVRYNENGSDDDDFVNPPNSTKSRRGGLSGGSDDENDKEISGDANETRESAAATVVSKDEKKEKQTDGVSLEENIANGKELADTYQKHGKQQSEDVKKEESSKDKNCFEEASSVNPGHKIPNPESVTYAESDFTGFDKDRTASCFVVDQIWAAYDRNGCKLIPRNQLLRLSHQIPVFRQTGEGDCKLRGFVELDPASVPHYPRRSTRQKQHVRYNENGSDDDDYVNPPNSKKLRGDAYKTRVLQSAAVPPDCGAEKGMHLETGSNGPESEGIQYPDPEFYTFEASKSYDKFQIGQIWALYSDVDGLPKFYGQIKNFASTDFEVEIKWLLACPVKGKIRWSSEELPTGCGRFFLSHKTATFDSPMTFSHQVKAGTPSKNRYDIYPSFGQIWAVYKNLRSDWTRKDMENCEYELVRVQNNVFGNTAAGFRVMILEKVGGYNAVFRDAGVEKEIPRNQLLRFSHQIPAFRLTEEGDGKLKGFVELDPAAVPPNECGTEKGCT